MSAEKKTPRAVSSFKFCWENQVVPKKKFKQRPALFEFHEKQTHTQFKGQKNLGRCEELYIF